MSWFLRVLSEFFTFLSDKMFYQLFFFNLVERKVRLFTNKQEFLTLLHLMSFGQFQNLSEETWSRAAENLFELCFVAFLATKVRNISYSFEYCSRLQKLSRYRFCITLYMLSGNKRSNLNELKFHVKFCEIKAEDFQATFLILFAYRWSRE